MDELTLLKNEIDALQKYLIKLEQSIIAEKMALIELKDMRVESQQRMYYLLNKEKVITEKYLQENIQ